MVTIVFSKNRAMQLDLCLRSLKRQCVDYEDLDIRVIFKCDPPHEQSYKNLILSYPNVTFIKENVFKDDLLTCFNGQSLVFLVCDDAIFTHKFNTKEIAGWLTDPKDIYASGVLGFSLRLGLNTTQCYSLNKEQKIPEHVVTKDGNLVWDWTQSEHDFAYPLELSSSVLFASIVFQVLQPQAFSNPNDCEWLLYQSLPRFMNFRPYLMSYSTSVAFCNPCNKVQTVNNNRSGFNPSNDPENLLHLYEQGFRLSAEEFDGFVSDGAHQESSYYFVTTEVKQENELQAIVPNEGSDQS